MPESSKINITERDLRQILLMIKNLQLFNLGKIDLLQLIENLRGLLHAIEFDRNDWKDAMEALINDLDYHEYIEENRDVELVVDNLKSLTNSFLTDYLTIPDPKIDAIAIAEEPNWLICTRCYEAWQTKSLLAMVVCPRCENALHNPFFILLKNFNKAK